MVERSEAAKRIQAIKKGGLNMATIKVIPKVAFILLVMPFLLFAIVLWTPFRKFVQS